MEFIRIQRAVPLFDEVITQFKKLYPDKKCIIAGGAVRDLLLNKAPKDIDVYFLGVDWTVVERDAFELKVKDMQSAEQVYYAIATANLPWHKYERYLLLSIIWENCRNLKNADVQFMGFPADTIEAVLETFDWEICIFGYENGEIVTTQASLDLLDSISKYNVKDKEYKPPQMKLCNVQFPISNLRRGFKFEARYPVKLEYESILKLCQEVIVEDLAKNETQEQV